MTMIFFLWKSEHAGAIDDNDDNDFSKKFACRYQGSLTTPACNQIIEVRIDATIPIIILTIILIMINNIIILVFLTFSTKIIWFLISVDCGEKASEDWEGSNESLQEVARSKRSYSRWEIILISTRCGKRQFVSSRGKLCLYFVFIFLFVFVFRILMSYYWFLYFSGQFPASAGVEIKVWFKQTSNHSCLQYSPAPPF